MHDSPNLLICCSANSIIVSLVKSDFVARWKLFDPFADAFSDNGRGPVDACADTGVVSVWSTSRTYPTFNLTSILAFSWPASRWHCTSDRRSRSREKKRGQTFAVPGVSSNVQGLPFPISYTVESRTLTLLTTWIQHDAQWSIDVTSFWSAPWEQSANVKRSLRSLKMRIQLRQS